MQASVCLAAVFSRRLITAATLDSLRGQLLPVRVTAHRRRSRWTLAEICLLWLLSLSRSQTLKTNLDEDDSQLRLVVSRLLRSVFALTEQKFEGERRTKASAAAVAARRAS